MVYALTLGALDDAAIVGKIRRVVGSAGGNWASLHTSSTYTVWVRTDPKAPWIRKFTMSFRMWAAKPDKLRVEILDSNLPVLKGMALVRAASKMQAYDSLSMRTLRSDVEKLFGGEMPGFDTSATFITTLFDVDFDEAEYVGAVRLNGRRVHHVKLVGKQTYSIVGQPGQKRDAYFDAETLLPVREAVYDAAGMRILTITYSDVRAVAKGRRAPTRIEAVNVQGGKLIFHLEWIDGRALLGRRVEMIQQGGKMKAEFRHGYAWLDRRIESRMFDIR
jgi:outer membrane lipoprotein-sorting protein